MLHTNSVSGLKFLAAVLVVIVAAWVLYEARPASAAGANNGMLDITFISQGYSDFNAFHADAQRFSDYLLTIEPFKSRASQIVFRNVDNSSDLVCAYAGSGLECNEANAIAAVEASGTPYDKIIAIVNSPQYGGRAKTTVASIYNGADGPKVFVHEFGHLLGGLRDEYTIVQSSGTMSGWYEKNCYMGLPPASEWSSVALRDYGIGCIHPNWSRPSKSSIMFAPLTSKYFDVIAQEMINQKFDEYAGPFDDTTAPSASITSLVPGSTVSGAVSVVSDITDNTGIVRVELWKDGVHYTTSYEEPFSFVWNPPLNEQATHTFEVRAYDVSGNVGSSGVVSVTIQGGVADTEKPTALLVSPVHGDIVSGTKQIQIYATDNSDVLGTAYFYVDGSLVGTDASAPFAYDWVTTGYAQGSHYLYAYVYDTSNNWVVTSPATVVVDNVPPVVSVVSPAASSTISGTTSIQVIASDDPGPVSRVDITVDGAPVTIDTTAPYEYAWDTTTVPNGVHVIRATAYDARSYTHSEPITVTVNNPTPDATPPTVSITSPLNNAQLSRNTNVTIRANASDNVAVQKVEFFVGTALKCTDTSSPYTCVWRTPSTRGTQTLKAVATDTSGNKATSQITVNIR